MKGLIGVMATRRWVSTDFSASVMAFSSSDLLQQQHLEISLVNCLSTLQTKQEQLWNITGSVLSRARLLITRKANIQTTHIQVQNYKKIVLVMSLKYTPDTQSILRLIILMCTATMHKKTTVDKKRKTVCSL